MARPRITGETAVSGAFRGHAREQGRKEAAREAELDAMPDAERRAAAGLPPKRTGFLETPGSTGRPMSKYNKEYTSPSSEGDRFSMQDRRAQGQAESEGIIRNADYDSSGMDRNIFNNRLGTNPYNRPEED